jgi:hypothetical protein
LKHKDIGSPQDPQNAPDRYFSDLQHIVLVVRNQDPAHQLNDEPRFCDSVNTEGRKGHMHRFRFLQLRKSSSFMYYRFRRASHLNPPMNTTPAMQPNDSLLPANWHRYLETNKAGYFVAIGLMDN